MKTIPQAEYLLLKRIVDTADEVRDLQKSYFKTRAGDALSKSKLMERNLDELLDQLHQGEMIETPDLFEEPPAEKDLTPLSTYWMSDFREAAEGVIKSGVCTCTPEDPKCPFCLIAVLYEEASKREPVSPLYAPRETLEFLRNLMKKYFYEGNHPMAEQIRRVLSNIHRAPEGEEK